MTNTWKLLACLLWLALPAVLPAQTVEELLEKGIERHDAGDYNAAIDYYQQALRLEPGNVFALGELATTFMAMENYEEGMRCAREVLKRSDESSTRLQAYVVLGSAQDMTGKVNESIETLKEGIREFPKEQLLHFNLAITLMRTQEWEDAIPYLRNSLRLKPGHPGSHYSYALAMALKGERIPCIMAATLLMILDPASERARVAWELTDKMFNAGIESEGKKTKINVNASDLDSTRTEDNFGAESLILSLQMSLEAEKMGKKSLAERLSMRYSMLGSMLDDYAEHGGFAWQFYAPFYFHLQKQGYTEVLGYVMLLTVDEKAAEKWMDKHEVEVRDFISWLQDFEFNVS